MSRNSTLMQLPGGCCRAVLPFVPCMLDFTWVGIRCCELSPASPMLLSLVVLCIEPRLGLGGCHVDVTGRFLLRPFLPQVFGLILN
jgi:hypothetical protein